MNIAFVSADWSTGFERPIPGGAGWYRAALPAMWLTAAGHKVAHTPNLAASRRTGEIYPVGWYDDEADMTGYDVIVMIRWMNKAAPEVIRRARAYGQVIVQDCDDWLFGLDPSNAAFRSTHPKFNASDNRTHYLKVMAASSFITCSTPFLAERLGRLAPTVVVRNAIDLDRWKPGTGGGEVTTVGWVGATPWRSGDLETMRGVLGPYLRRHGFRFVHHGHRPGSPTATELMGLGEEQVGPTRNMVPITAYPSLFDGIDIGIVPLRMTPFNEAKSCIKSMEYSAAHVPYVAQASSENLWYDRPSCAKRPKDWVAALERLADPVERKTSVARLVDRVRERDIARRWVDWQEVYASLSSAL